MLRHTGVDLAGHLYETGAEVVLPRLTSEIEGINRNTMAAQAGSGVEGREAEGFGGRGLNHLPYIYIHSFEQKFEFIDQRV